MTALLEDPVAETLRLLGRAEEEGLTLRAVGGIAVWLRCPSLAEARPRREFHDLDLAGSRREAGPVVELLENEGYLPQWQFNRLAGGTRLLFRDSRDGRRVDVFLDRLEMCHTLAFRDRLVLELQTLPLADLLLSKLQIVKMTDRDVVDVAALLADHDLGMRGGGATGSIEVDRILAVCCNDWGWWRTVTGNLTRLTESWAAAGPGPGPDVQRAAARAGVLVERLALAPKSARWRLRAIGGERIPWYAEPEEVR